MIKMAKTKTGGAKVTFALPEEAVTGAVSVVGAFNGWTPGATPLQRRSNGTRSATVELPAGEHEFRYLADGGVWMSDPAAETAGDNSVVRVAA